jgi:hypothetical protein
MYLVVVCHLSLSVSPEGVEESIVGALSRLDSTAGEKVERASHSDGIGEHRGNAAESDES